MFTRQYELVDFGRGRKLERFGDVLLDRPAPAAHGEMSIPARWKQRDAQFIRTDAQSGRWKPRGGIEKPWTIRHEDIVLELKTTPFGHVGVFAEHAENWDWIARQVARASRPIRVLNLFAYTGGATLVAAAAGAEVVHVDSAKNVVAWARRNAVLSGLEAAAIRWIAEDAVKFVQRELKRGNRYDAVILDPPSYGHGPKGEVWKIERHLGRLVSMCAELTESRRAFMLLTCHSPAIEGAELEALFADSVFGHCQSGATSRTLSLTASDGRALDCGLMIRWP